MDEADLHELLSGRRRGYAAAMVRAGLHVAAWCYSAGMSLRNLGYDTGLPRVQRVSVPVISLGNITTGGTGKTPIAAWLANRLVAQGRKPGLISRGYRPLTPETPKEADQTANKSDQGNDEKRVLDRLCPGIPHLQQRDRIASAVRAVSEFGCDILILDDGFQHRRLHRDLDIVLIDALQPWGYGHVLPRGLLRERLAGLRRADLIFMTRADQCSAEQRLIIRAILLDVRGTDEHVGVAFTARHLVDVNWQPRPLNEFTGQKALTFCGIGNPSGFLQTVASLGVTCVHSELFSDHHHYGVQDLSQLVDRARELSADIVITTQKDLVKISPEAWSGPPLVAIEIGVDFVSGTELWESKLRQVMAIGTSYTPRG